MGRNHSWRWLGAQVAVVGFAGATQAAVLCVDPAGGTCETTITAAIAAAAAGDTIEIAAGTYAESVVIPAGLDGLSLIGSGGSKTIIDGVGLGAAGLQIGSSSVTVEALMVRNSEAIGITVDAGATGTTLDKVRVRTTENACIALAAGASSTTITKGKLENCGDDGIDANDGSNDVNGLVVSKTILQRIGAHALSVRGDAPQISGNQISNATRAVSILGDDAVVTKNKARGNEFGISVQGDRLTLERNSVEDSAVRPISVTCEACTAGSVYGNKVIRTSGDSNWGYDLDADAPGLVVEKNRAERVIGRGFYVRNSSVGIILEKNVARFTGGADDNAAFFVNGSDHTLTQNTAVECAGDGFFVDGTNITLASNRAQGNFGDGFDLDNVAAGVTLLDNHADRNTREGFDVSAGATGTTLTDNLSTANRRDFCDDGTGTIDGGGNSFSFPGIVCPAE